MDSINRSSSFSNLSGLTSEQTENLRNKFEQEKGRTQNAESIPTTSGDVVIDIRPSPDESQPSLPRTSSLPSDLSSLPVTFLPQSQTAAEESLDPYALDKLHPLIGRDINHIIEQNDASMKQHLTNLVVGIIAAAAFIAIAQTAIFFYFPSISLIGLIGIAILTKEIQNLFEPEMAKFRDAQSNSRQFTRFKETIEQFQNNTDQDDLINRYKSHFADTPYDTGDYINIDRIRVLTPLLVLHEHNVAQSNLELSDINEKTQEYNSARLNEATHTNNSPVQIIEDIYTHLQKAMHYKIHAAFIYALMIKPETKYEIDQICRIKSSSYWIEMQNTILQNLDQQDNPVVFEAINLPSPSSTVDFLIFGPRDKLSISQVNEMSIKDLAEKFLNQFSDEPTTSAPIPLAPLTSSTSNT